MARIKFRPHASEFTKAITKGSEQGIKEGLETFSKARKSLVEGINAEHLIDAKTLEKQLQLPPPKVKEINGELHVGKIKANEIGFLLESGQFRKVFKELGLEGVISEEIEKGIRKGMEGFPASKVAKLEEEVASLKSGKMKEYDRPIEDVKKLPEKQKSKLLGYCKKVGVVTTTAVGVVVTGGALALGIDQLISECHKAKGCFLFNASTGERGRCKMQNRSCAYPATPHRIPQCDGSKMDSLRPNLNLVMRYLKHNSKHDVVTRFEEYLKAELKGNDTYIGDTFKKIRDQTITNDDIKKFIASPGFEEKMDQFSSENKDSLEFSDFCNYLDDKERSETACVACSPSAAHNSIEYVNIDDLPETELPRCNTNPSLWEALAKISGDTPRDIADAIGFTDMWKTILTVVGCLIGAFVLIMGIGYVVYASRKNKEDDDEVSFSELENEDNEGDNDEEKKEVMEDEKTEVTENEKKTEVTKV